MIKFINHRKELKNYKQLEYIRNQEATYINTAFYPSQDTSVEMKISNAESGSYWFGAWNVNWETETFALCNDTNGIYMGFGNVGVTENEIIPSTGEHIVKLN